jgi:hypothetical protein
MRLAATVGAVFGLGSLLVASFAAGNQPDRTQSSSENKSAVAENSAQPARSGYVGDDACGSCHRVKVDTFHKTAHYLSSRPADKDSILGSFASGANTLATSNPYLSFRMEARDTGFYQVAAKGTAPFMAEQAERFDLVIGAGTKGQTYLYWLGDQLFQLPVSYWSEVGWVNSPGYRDGTADFDRPIVPRCLECHATYFESRFPPASRYATSGFVLGITCEKCHGPGREHAQREASEHAASKHEVSKTSDSSNLAILNPDKFSRERKMDLCAWCHAGLGTALAVPFTYQPGEPLDQYLQLPPADPDADFDVHGSQVELLEKSRCFQSAEMTCLTCHDVHAARPALASFSQRCLSCHKPETAMFPKRNHQAASDCVGCHMPLQETNLIVFQWNGKRVRPTVRSHWIKVYPSIATAGTSGNR